MKISTAVILVALIAFAMFKLGHYYGYNERDETAKIELANATRPVIPHTATPAPGAWMNTAKSRLNDPAVKK